jgi:prophage regulatory protein
MHSNEHPQPEQTTHSNPPTKPAKLIRLPVVMERTGLGRSSIFAGVKAKTFCAPVRLSARAVGWRETDIETWISERTTARPV